MALVGVKIFAVLAGYLITWSFRYIDYDMFGSFGIEFKSPDKIYVSDTITYGMHKYTAPRSKIINPKACPGVPCQMYCHWTKSERIARSQYIYSHHLVIDGKNTVLFRDNLVSFVAD